MSVHPCAQELEKPSQIFGSATKRVLSSVLGGGPFRKQVPSGTFLGRAWNFQISAEERKLIERVLQFFLFRSIEFLKDRLQHILPIKLNGGS